jgi:hypothetical protein
MSDNLFFRKIIGVQGNEPKMPFLSSKPERTIHSSFSEKTTHVFRKLFCGMAKNKWEN